MTRTPFFRPTLAILLCATALAAACSLGGCASPPGSTPGASTGAPTTQGVINATKASYDALSIAVGQASVLVDQGVLKGQDARNADRGFTQAKAGLDVALVSLRAAQAAANPASAAASGARP